MARYGTGTWDAEAYGNHRALVRVEEKADAVWVHIPWRRRDRDPEKMNVIFIDTQTSARVQNVCPVSVNREAGDFFLQPSTAPSDYFIYFLPTISAGRSNYPTVNYQPPDYRPDPSWLERNKLSRFKAPGRAMSEFPAAQLIEIQSIDEFNSFFPMEVIATAAETAGLLAAHPDAAYLLFPEDRSFSIRMTDDLPYRWVQSGPRSEFSGEACRGEFYSFQIGVFACRSAIEDVDVSFSDLKSPTATGVIPLFGMHSFNTRGVNWDGRAFQKPCPVPFGKIQALWCGVQVPEEIHPGTYSGEVTISPKGLPSSRIKLNLDVRNDVLADAGDSDPSRMSRLRWLDSRIAFDDDIVPPYTPLAVHDRTVSCLGRSLTISPSTGLPARLTSFFTPELTGIAREGRELLSCPIAFAVEDDNGEVLDWQPKSFSFIKMTPGAVGWHSVSEAGPFELSVEAIMEFDGFVEFKVSLTPRAEAEVRDIRLEILLVPDAARYMMGLGFRGGLRPRQLAWTWDQKKNQDSLWLGDVNAGLQVSLRDENYSRPLNTNFYLSKPLNLPPSWWNEGKGGCSVNETGGPRSVQSVLFVASSGPRRIPSGEVLHFNFNLLLTPFKPLDPRAQFTTRFFHAFKPIDEVAKTGANTINVHHATAINPYINYPFLRPAEMKAYIDEAHARGMRVKIYNTIRELSNRAPELFALRSLGDEIFSRGPGGGFSWLQEHLGSDYIAAWFVPELKDAAIINSGMSRWHNYYLEGIAWLAKNVGIDGLYIDDVAFDRTTMKRVRKILDRGRPGALIDLHSANQYNPRDGFASSANLYLEHFPYLNRLWFGEYFDYDSAPDYWLVEISGIPFGLIGEMLQDGGNPWRGMIYGMTNRLPWSGQNPARLWKVWDEFGIADARMIGYWSQNCPVKTDNENVLATAYVKDGAAMVALASWAREAVQCRLTVDWKALGLKAERAKICAPAIPDFQIEATFNPGDPISVDPAKGWLLILK
jgi:hypothetical protein